MSVKRIVSLIPSSTEIVCALGFEGQLVGRSHECDFPEPVKTLPVCTEPKFNPEGPSLQVDQRMKEVLGQALSVYRVYAERLKSLRPNIIITQSQCEVCAVDLREVQRVVAEWRDSPAQIVSLQPNTLADVWADINRVAQALGAAERGVELVAGLDERVRDIRDKTEGISEKPTVACIEWIEPLMIAGNWIPELVELAGGVVVLGEAGKHARWISWQELCDKDPDIIVVMPCGFGIERSRQDIAVLTQRPEWPQMKAVRAGRVYVVDGNQYFNRPGPRLLESLEILVELIHPSLFRSGRNSKAWEPL
jgi:iron complex transport system substrate-binding protein